MFLKLKGVVHFIKIYIYIQGVFFRGLQLWEQIEKDIFNLRENPFRVIWRLYVANTRNKNCYEVLYKKIFKT
jgi:hypothetical protein